MRIIFPTVFGIDVDEADNPIQQLAQFKHQHDGNLVPYTNGKTMGFLFRPGEPDEVLILPNTKHVRDGYQRVLIAAPDPAQATNDLSGGEWRRHPLLPHDGEGFDFAQKLAEIRNSWTGAFSFVEEDPSRNVIGLRRPQIGAVHAVHMHWIVSESPYDVRNLTGKLAKFPFETSLLGHHRKTAITDGKAMEYPHFVSVNINDHDVPLAELQDEEEPHTLRGTIPLPKESREVTPVKVTVRQLYRTKDSVVCSSTIAMEASEITVSNQVADLVGTTSAVVLHKRTEQVKPRNDGKWEFSRALLPGQGWYVYWESRDEERKQSATLEAAHAGQKQVTITPSKTREAVTMTPSNIVGPPSKG